MDSGDNASETDKDQEDNPIECPRRAAAKKARSQLIEWAATLSHPLEDWKLISSLDFI